MKLQFQIRRFFCALALGVLFAGCSGPGRVRTPDSLLVDTIFAKNVIHFLPRDSHRYDTEVVGSEDDGRVLIREDDIDWPRGRIFAEVTTRPIPKDTTVCDKWDRAGDVRLVREGAPDVEVVKFITAYGGETTHRVEVTDLAPFLRGPVLWKGFVDTWFSPGWEMDFQVRVEPDPAAVRPVWGQSLFYEPFVTAEMMNEGPLGARVTVPPGLSRIELRVLTSGHCTDGTGADEFETKDHVVAIDGDEVFRFRPWRDDCRGFRAINPYCRKWPDGSWSSDYDRSGWCPGDKVDPTVFDLTGALAPGEHTISLRVDGIRPLDADGQQGYWRISGYLLGWKEE